MKVSNRRLIVIWFLVFNNIIFNSKYSFSYNDRVSAIIHVSSNVSDGEYSIEEIVYRAKSKGIDVIFFSDHDFVRVEYGLPYLRNILKFCVDKPSVFKFGVEKYFKVIDEVQSKYPDMFLFPGVECTPYYFWTKKNNTFYLNDSHKHFLITNLNEKDLKNLPTVSNINSYKINLLLFWPIVLIIIGIFFIKGIVFKKIGWVFIFIGFLFLANNFPFRNVKYTQYSGFVGLSPYQEVIDYVKDKGGLIFWAHPEAGENVDIPNIVNLGKFNVKTITLPYYEDLLNTTNYTGFAIFWEGYEKVGKIGGIWDKVLLEYCEGKRDRPVWAIGELEYQQEGESGIFIDSIQNIIFVKNKDKKSIIESIRNGKMYVLKKGRFNYYPILEEFSVNSDGINIKVKYSDEGKRKILINLIKNGILYKNFEEISPIEIKIKDVIIGNGYFRLEIISKEEDSIIITNPIFVGR
jgi:hypothetical protein